MIGSLIVVKAAFDSEARLVRRGQRPARAERRRSHARRAGGKAAECGGGPRGSQRRARGTHRL